MMVDISVNMFLETHIYSHLNKNKVNTKSVTIYFNTCAVYAEVPKVKCL